MDDEFNDNDDEQVDPDEAADETPKGLRRAAAAGKKAKADADALRRENLMLRAGVDIDSGPGKYFAKGYDGELTLEAVKSEWASLAPKPNADADLTPPATPDPVLTDDDLTSTRERQNLAHGAASDTPPAAVSGKVQAQKVFADAIAADRPDDEARALAFHALVSAAAAGDQSVIIVPNH